MIIKNLYDINKNKVTYIICPIFDNVFFITYSTTEMIQKTFDKYDVHNWKFIGSLFDVIKNSKLFFPTYYLIENKYPYEDDFIDDSEKSIMVLLNDILRKAGDNYALHNTNCVVFDRDAAYNFLRKKFKKRYNTKKATNINNTLLNSDLIKLNISVDLGSLFELYELERKSGHPKYKETPFNVWLIHKITKKYEKEVKAFLDTNYIESMLPEQFSKNLHKKILS